MYDQNVQSPRRVELQRKIKLYEETFDMMICKLGPMLFLLSILVLLLLLLQFRSYTVFLSFLPLDHFPSFPILSFLVL